VSSDAFWYDGEAVTAQGRARQQRERLEAASRFNSETAKTGDYEPAEPGIGYLDDRGQWHAYAIQPENKNAELDTDPQAAGDWTPDTSQGLPAEVGSTIGGALPWLEAPERERAAGTEPAELEAGA